MKQEVENTFASQDLQWVSVLSTDIRHALQYLCKRVKEEEEFSKKCLNSCKFLKRHSVWMSEGQCRVISGSKSLSAFPVILCLFANVSMSRRLCDRNFCISEKWTVECFLGV